MANDCAPVHDADTKYKRDRLPAFAGIARKYQAIMGYGPDSYVAGFWKQELGKHLLWIAVDQKEPCEMAIDDCVSAPSWSWANAESSVMLQDILRQTSFARVLCVTGNPTGLEAFGVIRTTIVLEMACIAVCQMQTDSGEVSVNKSKHDFYFPAVENLGAPKPITVEVCWDIRKWRCPESVLLVLLDRMVPGDKKITWLVLEKNSRCERSIQKVRTFYYSCAWGKVFRSQASRGGARGTSARTYKSR